MWGAIAGAALSATSSIIGSARAKKQAEKAEAQLDLQRKQNEDWYNRRYNEDYTQTAEAQRALTLARENAQQQLAAARGRQAVVGGTEESVAATQEAVNRGLAETMSGIAAQGTARRDAVEDTYLRNRGTISQQYMQMYNNRANAVSQGASNASQGFTNFAMSDLSAHLDTGKGIFGDQFRKRGYYSQLDIPRN